MLSLRVWAGKFPVHLNGDSGKPAGAAIRFCKSSQHFGNQRFSGIPNPWLRAGVRDPYSRGRLKRNDLKGQQWAFEISEEWLSADCWLPSADCCLSRLPKPVRSSIGAIGREGDDLNADMDP